MYFPYSQYPSTVYTLKVEIGPLGINKEAQLYGRK